MNKLLVLQKRAVRIVDTANYYRCHTDPLYIKFKLLKVFDVYFLSCSLFVYKFKFNLLPKVCSSLLTLNFENNMTYNFRHVSNFNIPSYRTSLREKCIQIRGPKYWDSIADDIKSIDLLSSFKHSLRNSIIDKY